MKRLDNETWKNIFRNISELEEHERYDGAEWVEVICLEESDKKSEEWVLCYGEELFEDGFKSEKEAQDRLNYLENLLL